MGSQERQAAKCRGSPSFTSYLHLVEASSCIFCLLLSLGFSLREVGKRISGRFSIPVVGGAHVGPTLWKSRCAQNTRKMTKSAPKMTKILPKSPSKPLQMPTNPVCLQVSADSCYLRRSGQIELISYSAL